MRISPISFHPDEPGDVPPVEVTQLEGGSFILNVGAVIQPGPVVVFHFDELADIVKFAGRIADACDKAAAKTLITVG